MPGGKLQHVLGQIGKLVASRQAEDLPDQELLTRFLMGRDEAAFAALMERHGAMVFGVCRRVLNSAHDAEDACQAVFLVLARKASSVRKRGSLSSWLHGVAWRVARKLRATLARRRARESSAAAQQPVASEPADLTWREVLHILEEELNRLPERYKAPLVLCHLEGRTQDEAAHELGCRRGTLRDRLERGRAILRSRLARRGVTGAGVLTVAALTPGLCSAAVPPTLVVTTVHASLAMAAGEALPTAIPAHVAALARALLRTDLMARLRVAVGLGLLLLAVGLGRLWAAAWGPDPMPRQPARVEHWSEIRHLQGHKRRGWCVAFSPDGKLLASGAGGTLPSPGELRLWDAVTGKLLGGLDTPHGVRCVAFAPDSKTLATAEHDSIARLRDARTGAVLRTFRGHASNIDAVSFAPDGKTLATSSWDKTVKLWDTATGKEVRTLPRQGGQVFTVAFGNDGTLAAAGVNQPVTIWDLATGQPRFQLKGHRGVEHWLAYSPDGKLLATASWDKTVKLWTTATGKLLATLRGHRDPVLGVAFAPDGRTLASCSGKWSDRKTPPEVPSPGEVILWDVATHKARARLRDHRDRVFGVAFSPDSNTLASIAWDGSVKLWQRDLSDGPTGDTELNQFVGTTADPDPKAEANQDIRLPFQGEPENRDRLEWVGPAAEQCVYFEPAGLRIALPAGFARERPNTGLRIAVPARGNFEVTVSYEILAEPEPADAGKRATKLTLLAILDEEDWTVAALTRRVATNVGPQVTAWTIRNNAAGKRETKYREFPAQAKVGRLRVVRSGTEVSYYVADGAGADLALLATLPCSGADLRSIDLVGSTGGPKAALDVRLTDLRVRTGVLVNAPEVPSLTWTHAVLPAALLAGLVVSMAVLMWWYVRRRRAAGTPRGA